MIKTYKLSKSFDDCIALNNVSCTINSGCIYGMVGSNGAGKSTFLRLLTGIYKADNGKVYIDDELVYENPVSKNKICFVPDEIFFLQGANMDRMARLYSSIYNKFDYDRYHDLTNTFGLNPKKNLNSFSKGMKRQASVICGLASNTEILLLDEAFDGLDPTMRITVRKMLIESMADSNATVIISSHNLVEIEQLCDAVGLIHKGRVVFDRELDCIKESIHKIQASFDEPVGADDIDGAEILDIKTIGSVQTFIAKGDAEQIKALMIEKGAKFCDIIPLTLDEIFIYEMEGQGYDSTDIDR